MQVRMKFEATKLNSDDDDDADLVDDVDEEERTWCKSDFAKEMVATSSRRFVPEVDDAMKDAISSSSSVEVPMCCFISSMSGIQSEISWWQRRTVTSADSMRACSICCVLRPCAGMDEEMRRRAACSALTTTLAMLMLFPFEEEGRAATIQSTTDSTSLRHKSSSEE